MSIWSKRASYDARYSKGVVMPSSRRVEQSSWGCMPWFGLGWPFADFAWTSPSALRHQRSASCIAESCGGTTPALTRPAHGDALLGEKKHLRSSSSSSETPREQGQWHL